MLWDSPHPVEPGGLTGPGWPVKMGTGGWRLLSPLSDPDSGGPLQPRGVL